MLIVDSRAEARHLPTMALRAWLGELGQDVKLALRIFRRMPVFVIATVLTLSIGIGANGAVFSVLQSALLQPLPYRRPQDLAMLRLTTADRLTPDRFVGNRALSSSSVLAWRRYGTDELGEVAALLTRSGNLAQGIYESQIDLAVGDRVMRLNGAFATPNFFSLLGVSAAHGRVFSDADEGSADPLIVLSEALWRREFGGDSSIIGRPIIFTLGLGPSREPRAFVVAGVLPRGFQFTYPDEIEAWVMMPWADVAQYNPSALAFSGVARLRPGVSLAQARRRAAELPTGEASPTTEPPQDRHVIGLISMPDWVVNETRPSLVLLGAVAALLLFITCVNVANGLLARVSERQQELAVRSALGASRSRLARQVLVEGTLLSIAGALIGTALAVALQQILRALLPASVPRVGEISVNASIIVFAIVMAGVTTILSAVVPALNGTRLDAAATLMRAGSGVSAGPSMRRWRYLLVGSQAAIASSLLIAAALLLMSFWRLGRVPLGFDGEKVVTVDLQLLSPRYHPADAMPRFQDELIARVRAIPGIADVGLTSALPFRGVDYPVQISHRGIAKMEIVRKRTVDSGYFRALRISPIRGRLFDSGDQNGSQSVTVISASYAREVFGAENPIGQFIGDGRRSPMLEVVGVVGDTHYAGREQDPAPAIYIPMPQDVRPLFSLVARTRPNVEGASVVTAIRQAVRAIDPALPPVNFTTIDQILDATVANRRFYTVATVAFASISLALTIIGLVAVIGRVVTERRRELAIRACLGATMTALARVATRDVLVAVSLGIVGGVVGTSLASFALTRFLFHVAPRSPVTYAGVSLLVLAVGGVAAWAPVRRFSHRPLLAMLKAD